jgi:hypothetical protein
VLLDVSSSPTSSLKYLIMIRMSDPEVEFTKVSVT